jgi:hypothetical protein
MIKKIVRPDVNVAWPVTGQEMDATHVEHFYINYTNNGKQIFRNVEDSDTGLERTLTVLWESKEVWEEFSADPIMQEMRDKQAQVFRDLGITEEIVSLSEI